MSNLLVPMARGRRTIVKIGPWLACSFSALLWSACGETEKNSEAEPAASSANAGSGGSADTASETASTTSAGSGGNAAASSTTPPTNSGTSTTGQGEPASGGAPATTTTDQGAAGADPTSTGGTGTGGTGTGGTGTGGTGGSVEPDDGCEVKTLYTADDVCQVEASCVEFVQHTNCRLNAHDMWQCDTDEHDNSKPHTLTGNPGWFDTVTGTSDAAAACDAVVAVNLKRSSVMASDLEDCSEFSIESASSVAHIELCGTRYLASTGATVWKEQPASASCSESEPGQTCQCLNTGADDGEYELDAPDLESALADVWEFCTNSSPRVPVQQRECELVGADTGSDGSCDDVRNCLLDLTDASGLDLEQRVYQEVLCSREAPGAALICTCRLGDETFSFSPTEAPGVSACEDLASACDARNTIEREDAPAECERDPELIGHDTLMQSYVCSIPIVLGAKSGLTRRYGGLVCEQRADAALGCKCSDSFTGATFPLEPNTPDVETAWDLAVAECEALLEASPGEL